MKNFCLIGYPIEHSFSPKMHNNWFKEYGIDAQYSLEEINTGELESKIDYLKKNFTGFNVTYPLKQEIIPHLSNISSEAKNLGSVNTVVVKDGKLEGYNTDIVGTRTVLDKIKKDHSYILGNGNMAKTVVHSINNNNITVVCRNLEKAKKGLVRKDIQYISYDDFKAIDLEAILIINTLPLTLDITALLQGKYHNTLLDCNYNNKFKYNVEKYIDGLELLILQGAEAFRIWTGKMPDDLNIIS